MPPFGAAAESVTVPVVETTAGTLAGFRVTEETVCETDKLESNMARSDAQANRAPTEESNLEIFTLNPPQDFVRYFPPRAGPNTKASQSSSLYGLRSLTIFRD
jgi:hypothetical protein